MLCHHVARPARAVTLPFRGGASQRWLPPPSGSSLLPHHHVPRARPLVVAGAASIDEAYEHCRALTADFAKTFYFATAFQDKSKANSIFAIYAWCRELDETVDNAAGATDEELEAQLTRKLETLQWTFAGGGGSGGGDGEGSALEDVALCDTVKRTPALTIAPFEDMILGMRMDVRPSVRYRSFEDELYLYCYRVAGTVALMTIPVLGTAGGATFDEAVGPGVALGVALQITNIVRDVGEDARRGRIYLPTEDMELFGVTEEDIMQGRLTDGYKALVEFEIQRALAYYAKAEEGVALLAPESRLAVLSALGLYRKILEGVRDNGYNNFTLRSYTSKSQKLGALPGLWWRLARGGVGGGRWRYYWLDAEEPRRGAIHRLFSAAAVGDPAAAEAAALALAEQNPTPLPAQGPAALGEWELLWSSPGSDYSRLRGRLDGAPVPVPSRSAQVISEDTSKNVVEVGPLRVTIAASIAPDGEDEGGRRVLVGPPYTFQLKVGPLALPLKFPEEFGQERTVLEQLYVDEHVRVSRVGAFGERTTPGSVFLHVRG